MKRKRDALLHILCAWSVFFVLPSMLASPAVAPVKVLVVRQTNSFFGHITLYVGSKGMKFCEDSGEFEIVCGPPKWTVLVFRTDSHEGIERPLSEWAEHGLGIMNPRVPFAGVKTTEVVDPQLKIACRVMTVESKLRLWAMNDPLIFQHNTKQKIKLQRLVCSKSIDLAPQAQLFLRGLYCVRTFGTPGIPLDLSYSCTDGSVNHEYSTVSIKEKELGPETFAYPSSFKKVTSQAQLLIGGKRKQQLRDFADTLIDSEMEERKKN